MNSTPTSQPGPERRALVRSDDLNVGDPVTRKTRLLSRQCQTCIFRTGNPMHLEPGRLARMVREAQAAERYIICHDTLPYGQYPDSRPAICRGFFDRYSTLALQLFARLWGFHEVDPPSPPADPQPTSDSAT
jgi:hypothetical protein